MEGSLSLASAIETRLLIAYYLASCNSVGYYSYNDGHVKLVFLGARQESVSELRGKTDANGRWEDS